MNADQLNQVCYRYHLVDKPWTLSAYESIGGYQVWRRLLKEKNPGAVLEEIKKSMLRGRGGAGFSSGIKWSFMNRDMPGQKYLICNSDEGEPGTCKDTNILLYNPHQVLEGIMITSYVIGATVCYNYLRGEFFRHWERMELACQEALSAGLMGQNIQGTGFDFQCYNLLGAGSFVVGEETAMMESIEGKQAMPRYKPPFPAAKGLYGQPTTIHNTETLASVPVILEKGADWFLQQGTEKSGGTKVFCVSGHVKTPRVFEIGLGLPFRDLLDMCGGMRSHPLKAVIPGGTSMKILTADEIMDLNMDYESLQSAGSSLGSGGVIVFDESTCMVRALHYILRFYRHESCGQCTPCREGVDWLDKILKRMITGHAKDGDVEAMLHIASQVEGKTICAFGEAFAWPVTSFIKKFKDEFDHYEHYKTSKVEKEYGVQAFAWETKDG